MSNQTPDKVPGTPLAAPNPPVNPFHNGIVGRTSLLLTFALVGLFALFLILDTVQFTLTGHESGTFTALTRAVGGLGLGSLLVTLGKTYFTKRVQ